jgi:hypothetical protein
VVYDPTVGAAIECYSDEYRGQRGVYLSIDCPDEIAESFETFGLGPDDVDLIVCSDAEEILGIGDWGVGGIQIAIGKLAICTAGAGVDPTRTIAVSLDVGTDNETLLNDPFYLGNRHARHRGADYDPFIETYIETAHRLFPNAEFRLIVIGGPHEDLERQVQRGKRRGRHHWRSRRRASKDDHRIAQVQTDVRRFGAVIDCREDFQLPRGGHRQQPGDRIGDRPRTQLRDYILALHTI